MSIHREAAEHTIAVTPDLFEQAAPFGEPVNRNLLMKRKLSATIAPATVFVLVACTECPPLCRITHARILRITLPWHNRCGRPSASVNSVSVAMPRQW